MGVLAYSGLGALHDLVDLVFDALTTALSTWERRPALHAGAWP